MGVIAEKDLIIFLKKVLGLSDNDSVEVRNSEKTFQSSDNDIVEGSTIPKEYVDDDYVDDEEIFRHVPIEIKEIIRDEMANEDISYDKLCSYTITFIDNNGYYDKLSLLEENYEKIITKPNCSNVVAVEVGDLMNQIKSEYRKRAIAKYKEMYPDEYEQITNL